MASQVPIALIGYHEYTPYLLSKLSENDHADPKLLIVQSDTPVGPPDSCEIPGYTDISVFRTDSVNTDETKEAFTREGIELGICLGWYEILQEGVLNAPEWGVVGIHASPLPEGRGHAPVNYQIIYGREEATVSAFELTPEVDAGGIVGQYSVPILEGETVSSLYSRLMYRAAYIIDEAVVDLAMGTPELEDQAGANASYWPERRPADSLLDWEMDAAQLERFVRALADPYPNAFTYHASTRISLLQTSALPVFESDMEAGQLIANESADELLIQTGTGALQVERARFGDDPVIGGGELADELGLGQGDRLGDEADFPEDFAYTGLRGPSGKSDLEYETNVQVGETATNNVYCFVPRGPKRIGVEATAGDEMLVDESLDVDGHRTIPIKYTPDSPGAQFIEIRFRETSHNPRRFYIYSGYPEGG